MSKSKYITSLAIIIILFYVYRIFLIKRLPYAINDNISWNIFFIVILLLITQGFIAIKVIQELRKQQVKPPTLVLQLLQIIYYNPLQQIREHLLKLTFMKKLVKDWSGVIEFTICSKINRFDH